MAEPFNPYSQWLGIPPHYQPADHYRLLGVPRFEIDHDIIATAADWRLSQLAALDTADAAALAKLMREVAEARECLLDPETKEMYDAALEGAFRAEAAAPKGAAPETHLPRRTRWAWPGQPPDVAEEEQSLPWHVGPAVENPSDSVGSAFLAARAMVRSHPLRAAVGVAIFAGLCLLAALMLWHTLT